MKEITILFLFLVFLNAQNIEYYFYTINMDYKEYDSSGAFLDGDSADVGNLNGIGIEPSEK